MRTAPKQALAEIMVCLNPALDWDGYARALSDAGYHALAEDVTTKYMKGERLHSYNTLIVDQTMLNEHNLWKLPRCHNRL